MTQNREQSEFNMAISYLNRLNTLFYLADESSMKLDINQWMHTLFCLFREISTEMKQEEIEEMKQELNAVNHKIQEHNKNYMRTGKNDIGSDIYHKLSDIELKIRKVMKDSGLQMKMKDDASTALR